VPPLRDRLDDLPLLAAHFLARGQPPRPFDEIPQHAWGPEPLEQATSIVPLRIARRLAVDTFEVSYLERLLAHTGNNVTRSAALAEVSRQMIQQLMRMHGY
jgi:DNA-binding NtrC family response regulator